MISTDDLKALISDYLDECYLANKRITYRGLGRKLNIHHSTLRNYVLDKCGSKPYRDPPGPNRKINNTDFQLIREALKEVKHPWIKN